MTYHEDEREAVRWLQKQKEKYTGLIVLQRHIENSIYRAYLRDVYLAKLAGNCVKREALTHSSKSVTCLYLWIDNRLYSRPIVSTTSDNAFIKDCLGDNLINWRVRSVSERIAHMSLDELKHMIVLGDMVERGVFSYED